MPRAPEAFPDVFAWLLLRHARAMACPGISPGEAARLLLEALDRGEIVLEVRQDEHGHVVDSRLVRGTGGERSLRAELLGSASHAR